MKAVEANSDRVADYESKATKSVHLRSTSLDWLANTFMVNHFLTDCRYIHLCTSTILSSNKNQQNAVPILTGCKNNRSVQWRKNYIIQSSIFLTFLILTINLMRSAVWKSPTRSQVKIHLIKFIIEKFKGSCPLYYRMEKNNHFVDNSALTVIQILN